MFKHRSTGISTASCLLVALVLLGIACKSGRSVAANDPIRVTVQPRRSKEACIGDLIVTLRNRSDEDLTFASNHLPWDYNAQGLNFVVYREDGSTVHRTPMIADPIVGMPTVLKHGKELSHMMSLLVYYVELPKELDLHDLRVRWSYFAKPTNLTPAKALSGEFVLKKLTQSDERRTP